MAGTTITVEWNGDQVVRAIEQAASRGVLKSLHHGRNEGIDLILREKKTGRQYGNHRASAPGEAPASDTGRYLQLIRVEHKGLKGRIIAAADYAEALERGTANMRARILWERVAKNIAPKVEAIMANEIRKVAR